MSNRVNKLRIIICSPMSHFSSSTGLLSHPGLASSGQLPHLKQEFSGKDSGGHLKSKCKFNIFN